MRARFGRSTNGVRFVVLAAMGGVGAVTVAVGAYLHEWSHRAPESDIVEIPDRFVRLLVERPTEGAAKAEEGRVGKREAKVDRARGNKIEVKKLEIDREMAEQSGVLGAMESSDPNAVMGGLGGAGQGIGGGGTATGLGGLGMRGMGKGGGQVVRDLASAEQFTDHGVNAVVMVAEDPLSTFAIDVDTGSYTIARRKLGEGTLPPAAAVRVEEFVNYLPYDYAPPEDGAPVAVHLEAAPYPWTADRTLLRVGVAAQELAEQKPVHLTFLVDVSGSMSSPDKLPLVKQSLRWLVDHLGPEDTVALATYAGSTRVALEPTPTSRRGRIHEAIEALDAGGSTAMNSGLELAYGLARRSFLAGCENRVVVLSDGDANVGPAGLEANLRTIRTWAGDGITLSTVGFGTGNYKDTLMEQLADQGDGNYSYIDSLTEAKRVFGEKLAGTVHTVARDVKLQVEFHPASVSAYRLVGYENRDIADADFRVDAVDAGEIGSGQQVTALYELVLAEHPTGPLATVHFRAKPSGEDAPAREWTTSIDAGAVAASLDDASARTRMALASATFAELLRESPYVGEASFADVARLVRGASRRSVTEDAELLGLVERAAALSGRPVVASR